MGKRLSLGFVLGTFLVGSMFVIALIDFSPAMAATITVTNTDDSGVGSLREAIASAAPGDTINFSVTGTITLTSGELLISKDLTITGPGASRLAISGNNASRVFRIPAGTVSISNVTIQNGNIPTGQQGGGGIFNQGTLTLNNVVVRNNTVNGTDSPDVGGGICNGWGLGKGTLIINDSMISGNTAARGGGIFNTGAETLTITNSTVTGNTAIRAGGILSYATVNMMNSTISNNIASNSSGGIEHSPLTNAPMTLTNVTISGNSSHPGFGDGISNLGSNTTLTNVTISGGIGIGVLNWEGSVISLRNTIIANNGANCYGTVTSLGYNLSSDNTCGFTGTGDQNKTDPLLGPLQDNGGPTFTHALLTGSPAINAADPNNFPPTDQRGVIRPQGAGPDIGAFEFGALIVVPEEGTIGTEMTILGSEFGAKKGKALVGNAVLKILEWTDDSIRCQLTKALPPETYDVPIRPMTRGASQIVLQNAFTVKSPEIDSVEPTSGATGSEITINGYYFGTKKGKVTLGKKTCKVLSWEMNSTTGQSTIRFAVPKGLIAGTNELKVTTTGVGSDTVSFNVD